MEQNLVAPALTEEAAAREALQKRIDDPAYPTLSLAQNLDNHAQAYKLNREELLSLIKNMSRHDYYQCLRMLRWTETIKAHFDKAVLSSREIQSFCDLADPVLQLQVAMEVASRDEKIEPGRLYKRCEELAESKKTASQDPLRTLKTSLNQSENILRTKTPDISGQLKTSGNAENMAPDTLKTPENAEDMEEDDDDAPAPSAVKGGYPLIRDSINETLRTFTFGHLNSRLGHITERWLIKARDTGWFKTGFLLVFMGFSFYGIYQGSTEIGHKVRDIYFRLEAQPGAGGQSRTVSGAPKIIDHDLLAGNRLRLTWSSAGPNMSYRVYYHPTDADFDEPLGQDVSTLGAIVDVNPVWKKAHITVTAIAPNEAESPHSNPITFLLKPENQGNTVTPLEEEGEQSNGPAANQYGGHPDNRPSGESASGSLSKKESHLSPPSSPSAAPKKLGVWDVLKSHAGALIGASVNNPLLSQAAQTSADLVGQAGSSTAPGPAPSFSPSPAPSYPGPTNLKAQPIPGSKNIQLTWQDMGAGYHYNLYASYASDMPSFDRDGYLLRQASATWVPPTKGLRVYLFYVTTVNPQGQESAPSSRILVDQR